jgi:hypothetical protein
LVQVVQRLKGQRPGGLSLCRGFGLVVLTALLAAAVAGCSYNTQHPPTPTVDPNLYPQNYRKTLAVFLSQTLTDRADFFGARVSQAVLKPVGGSEPHYVVCIQFNARSPLKSKMVIYLAGQVTQFIDAEPEQCSDAVYTPFTELEQVVPGK